MHNKITHLFIYFRHYHLSMLFLYTVAATHIHTHTLLRVVNDRWKWIFNPRKRCRLRAGSRSCFICNLYNLPRLILPNVIFAFLLSIFWLIWHRDHWNGSVLSYVRASRAGHEMKTWTVAYASKCHQVETRLARQQIFNANWNRHHNMPRAARNGRIKGGLVYTLAFCCAPKKIQKIASRARKKNTTFVINTPDPK